jgi:hypothetical protein
MLVAQLGLDKMVFHDKGCLFNVDDAFDNTRSYDLIGTWRTTQENMCNHSVIWL